MGDLGIYKGEGWIEMTQDRVEWGAFVNTKMIS
jgi:hypothetical protein